MKSLNRQLPLRFAVVGAAKADPEVLKIAFETGSIIARHGGILITGGRTGVMESASQGAFEAGGITVGILPGNNAADANPYVQIPIATGLGNARNAIIAQCADAVIGISGGYGTLSELALALKMKKTVYGINTWFFDPAIIKLNSPDDLIKDCFLHNG